MQNSVLVEQKKLVHLWCTNSKKKKDLRSEDYVSLCSGRNFIGRGERIRTSDPVHPMHVRYQAALRPDEFAIIAAALSICHVCFAPQ